jgi:iron complex transport system substrate-binding protein
VQPTSPPATPRGSAGFPVTIPTKFGSAIIPREPVRVLTIGFSEQDPVLAVGVKPIAVRDWFGEQPSATWPWAQPALGDARPEVMKMPFGQLNFEAIAALKPDLIVATHSGITEPEYATLAKIAPTLAQPGDYPDFGVPWQEQARLIGRALGRDEQAQQRIAAAEERIVATRKQHPQFEGATVAWASPAEGQGQYWAVGPTTPPMRFLATLGFRVPDNLAKVVGDKDSVQISGEQLTLLDTNVLIVQARTPEARATIEANPLFQQLRVAREGRALIFDSVKVPVYGALSFSTVLSLPFAVEQLVPLLVAAVDGNPATRATP